MMLRQASLDWAVPIASELIAASTSPNVPRESMPATLHEVL